MLTFLLVLGILWIFLKILTAMIELPFRILGFLFRSPFAFIFWGILILLIILNL